MSPEELARAHYRDVVGFFRAAGLPPEDAEERTQEVFARIAATRGYEPGTARPGTFVITFATYVLLEWRRDVRRDGRRLAATSSDMDGDELDPLERAAAGGATVEDSVSADDAYTALLSRLPHDDAIVCILLAEYDLSGEEVATIFGKSPPWVSAVRIRIRAAWAKLNQRRA